MTRLNRIARFALAFLFVLPFAAFAQDVMVTGGAATSDPTSLISSGLKTLFESAQQKNWALFVPTLVVLVVTLFRFIGGKVAAEGTKFRAVLDHKWMKWGMNFVTGFCLTLAGAASAGVAFSANVALNALMVSFTAAGGVEFFRDVLDSFAAKKPQDAGKNAVSNPGPTLNG